MKRTHKTILSATLLAATLMPASTYAANKEISCSSDPVFSQYSCGQCFEGKAIAEGDTLQNMSDDFKNDSSLRQIIFKEAQDMPKIYALSDKVKLDAKPDEEGMWEYTEDFNALLDEKEAGYVVPAGANVTWISSPLGYGYAVSKNEVDAGQNAALLVYNLKYRTMEDDGAMGVKEQSHNECVLYKSAKAEKPKVPTPEKPKELPKTGAESIFLGLFAMLAGLGIVAVRRKK